MQQSGYQGMKRLQEYHWWWRGMARLYATALSRFVGTTSSHSVIDIGCGFGANLPVLNKIGSVVGVDVSLDSLQAIEQRPTLGLVQARADALPFRSETFDVVAMLAIIEHIKDDDRAAAEAFRVGRPNSVLILLTSAFMALWSHHDTANNHFRRYYTAQMERLLRQAGWHIQLNTYINAIIFPAVLVVRVLQRQFKHDAVSEEDAEYDMGPSMEPINSALALLLRFETWLTVTARIKLPFGVDIFTVAKHEDS